MALSEAARTLKGKSVDDQTGLSFRGLLSKPAVFGSLIPVVTLLNALVGMLLPKLMAPRAFGEYSLVITLLNYGLIFDLGASQVIDRRMLEYLGTGRSDLA